MPARYRSARIVSRGEDRHRDCVVDDVVEVTDHKVSVVDNKQLCLLRVIQKLIR